MGISTDPILTDYMTEEFHLTFEEVTFAWLQHQVHCSKPLQDFL